MPLFKFEGRGHIPKVEINNWAHTDSTEKGRIQDFLKGGVQSSQPSLAGQTTSPARRFLIASLVVVF